MKNRREGEGREAQAPPGDPVSKAGTEGARAVGRQVIISLMSGVVRGAAQAVAEELLKNIEE